MASSRSHDAAEALRNQLDHITLERHASSVRGRGSPNEPSSSSPLPSRDTTQHVSSLENIDTGAPASTSTTAPTSTPTSTSTPRPAPILKANTRTDRPDTSGQTRPRQAHLIPKIRTSFYDDEVPGAGSSAATPDGPVNSAQRQHGARVRIAESPVSLTQPRQTFDQARRDVKPVMAPTREAGAILPSRGRRRKQYLAWASGPLARIQTTSETAYQRFIVEGLLRQKPLQPSKDGRHIPIRPGLARQRPFKDERTGHSYVTNFIRSSRYTIWDFLPKQLFFQFSKLANFYFLVIGIMQMIPGLSTTGTYTTIGPLIFFVALSMAKEGYDDYRRYKLDKFENKSSAWVLDPDATVQPLLGAAGAEKKSSKRGFFRREKAPATEAGAVTELDSIRTGHGEPARWARIQWQDLRVGDIIQLQRDDNVPADIVLLHATGPNGIAYIETMALDGETNLKSKQACPLLAKHCGTVAGMSSCEAEVVSEDPNIDLYNFEGRVTVGGETMPLTLNDVVYRGSTLRNTAQAIGLVINTGEECKIRMNANKYVRAKAPEMQYAVNRIVVFLVFFVVALSIGCTVGYIIWRGQHEARAFYLTDATVHLRQIFIAFVIAYNTLIPLSLYVSLEIVKLGQLYFLSDIKMYDPLTDTPMVANTTTILENLGQVSYVFSDKTGTLTENLMRFRKMSVAGTAWLHDADIRREAEKEAAKKTPQGAVKAEKAVSHGSPANLETVDEVAEGGPLESAPRRSSSTPFWKSTVRPNNAQPELNTEDLIRYIQQKPDTPFAQRARHLILCMALCHTCLPEKVDDGTVKFQAASPDELALVEAAQDLGYLVIDRAAQSITLETRRVDGSTLTETYEVLQVIEFSSKRKRMSIVIRMPDSKLCVFTKGADSVILPRLKQKQLAIQTAVEVERKASMRKSVEQEKALRRLSMQSARRESLVLGRASLAMDRRDSRRGSWRRSFALTDDVATWLSRRDTSGHEEPPGNDEAYHTPRHSFVRNRSLELSRLASDPVECAVDEASTLSEGAVFERCFQHVDNFATEGLRTLIFAYRYIDQEDYDQWKTVYHEATTSLVKRQERIEDAAELIEHDFDLAGATAIEDKLQEGVPETIDKLRRANIKVWMLTGDKRETAINIAHSARICKPFSEVYILDAMHHDLHDKLMTTLVDVGRSMVPHSVAVIDGHTLTVVEGDEKLRALFYDLMARVDSVICCRASPSQKANLVRCIRHEVPSSVTLAIGDGANDIAMIQASHVGIGISGREGLQAARVADYSIAQFRFLQRLLFVHGRWNYMRSGRYVLATFWKEIVFYLIQAQYQRYNGYTGTSIYESTALAVFNTIFTSLPVIIPGVFVKDLSAETLLAVPELYASGQRNAAFNFRLYLGWMVLGVSESVLIFTCVYYLYGMSHAPVFTDLFPLGTLAYSVAVVVINVKLLFLDVSEHTVVTVGALFLSLLGWFLWNLIQGAVMPLAVGPYVVRWAITRGFGAQAYWWLVHFLALSVVVALELGVRAVKKSLWPTDQDVLQQLEKIMGKGGVVSGGGVERGQGEDINMHGVGGSEHEAARGKGDGASLQTITSATSVPEAWQGSGTVDAQQQQQQEEGSAAKRKGREKWAGTIDTSVGLARGPGTSVSGPELLTPLSAVSPGTTGLGRRSHHWQVGRFSLDRHRR